MHEGKVLESLIKEKAGVSAVSEQLSVSRNHLYQLFKKPQLSKYHKLAFSKLLNIKDDKWQLEQLEIGQIYFRSIDEFSSFNKEERIKEYLKEYFNPLLKCIKKAEYKVVAKDYLYSKGLDQINQSVYLDYSDQRDKYFSELDILIDAKLKSNNNFSFVRIAELPINHFGGRDSNIRDEDICLEAIKMLYLEPFKHIAKNLKKCQNENRNYFQFILHDKPVVTKSIILVDEQYIVLEENSYDPSMASIPRSIEIKKASNTFDSVKSEIKFYSDILSSIIELKERSAINIHYYHLHHYISVLMERLKSDKIFLEKLLNSFNSMTLTSLKNELLNIYPECHYQIKSADSKVYILNCLMNKKDENHGDLESVSKKLSFLNSLD